MTVLTLCLSKRLLANQRSEFTNATLQFSLLKTFGKFHKEK